MINFFKLLFKSEPDTDYKVVISRGAIILDVRSKAEFANGHIRTAINVPLPELQQAIASYVDKSTPIITCCASGVRSASAQNILLQNGFKEVHNGGGWMSLDKQLKKMYAANDYCT
jgi:phage shock protein E